MQDGRDRFEDAVRLYGIRGLASKLGVTPAYISMIASGKRPLTPEVLTRLETGVNKIRERVKGFEPSALCLGSRYSTPELHPHRT